MKNRILFILHIPPPVHGSSIVGKYIKDSEVINSSFKTEYINLGTSKSIDDIGKKPLSKVSSYVSILYRTLKHLILFRPQVVYLAITAKGVGFYKDFFIAFIVKIFRIQLLLHFHNKGVASQQDKIVDNFLYKFVFKKTKVILLSKFLYPDIQKYVSKKDVYYCPNGVIKLNTVKNSEGNICQKVKLLFLSNLIESKGVYILLEALSKLKKQQLNFICNFVGGVGDINEVEFNKKVEELNLNKNVFYLGKKFNSDKESIFSTSEIFILPTFNDCFPLVLLEAMQFSLPLVSTFEGAVPEIIDDRANGFLVKQKSINELSGKLEILIKNKKLREEMGEAGFLKYSKNYTLEKFEQNMNGILNKIFKDYEKVL